MKPDEEYGLVEYGILQSKSDFTIHVGPHRAYIYVTRQGQYVVRSGHYPTRYARQLVGDAPQITAFGFIVPWAKIPAYLSEVPAQLKSEIGWPPFDKAPEKDKGQKAEAIVIGMAALKRLPIYCAPLEREKSSELQRLGIDLVGRFGISIQVKCDLPVAKTGNLYLQTYERNPKGQY